MSPTLDGHAWIASRTSVAEAFGANGADVSPSKPSVIVPRSAASVAAEPLSTSRCSGKVMLTGARPRRSVSVDADTKP